MGKGWEGMWVFVVYFLLKVLKVELVFLFFCSGLILNEFLVFSLVFRDCW